MSDIDLTPQSIEIIKTFFINIYLLQFYIPPKLPILGQLPTPYLLNPLIQLETGEYVAIDCLSWIVRDQEMLMRLAP